MILHETQIPNGDLMVLFKIYQCDCCGEEIPENYPHYGEGDKHYCLNCGFISGYITEKEYLNSIGMGLADAKATVHDGEIVVWVGKKAPWELKDKDYRNTRQYRNWRLGVFERDDYTCQTCEKRGGELEAHHIKTFNKHKNLRFEIDNGVTLCSGCHRLEHKRGV